jgi:DNA-directed RNA polymerase subunit RPC12/RpoP
MEIESLSCNNCGGPLDIPESANYVSCVHCSTQLAVKRTSSITYTEKLEAIQSQQEDMREKLVRLERESLVARIDREWEEEKQRFMIGGNDGQKQCRPTPASP